MKEKDMEIEHCEFPDDVYLNVENDAWLSVSPSENTAKIGATSVLSFLAGKLTSVKFSQGKKRIITNQTVATLESGKYFGPFRAPTSGTIARFNVELEKNPSLINRSPYDEGWIAELESFQSRDLDGLKRGPEARKELQARIRELKIHCFKALPDDEMLSIGTECSTTLANLNELLEKSQRGRIVHLVTDDPTSDIEMIRWSDQTKNRLLESRREGNLYHFIVEKTS